MKKSRGFEWAYRDYLTMLFIIFLAFAVLAVKPTSVPKSQVKGSLFIEMTWDPNADADVDLWVQTPNDPKPIGYLNKSGIYCNLLRDDQGKSYDPESNNSEVVICRGIPEGEWAVNAVLFRDVDEKLPLHVTLTVYKVDSSGTTQILTTKSALQYLNEEDTLASFLEDKNGNASSVVIDPPFISMWGG